MALRGRTMTHAFKIRPALLDDGPTVDADADKAAWLYFRQNCVGATDARKLVKLNGAKSKQWDGLLWQKFSGEESFEFDSFALGIEREPLIAAWVAETFPGERFVHNTLLLRGENARHVATPDMVGVGSLCEIKVSTAPLKKAKTTYRDQMQWQMHVTGAHHVLLVVENRFTRLIETEWIFRSQNRIDTLADFAGIFLRELDELIEVGGRRATMDDEAQSDRDLLLADLELSAGSEISDPFAKSAGDDPDTPDPFSGYWENEDETECPAEHKKWSRTDRTELIVRYSRGETINEISDSFKVVSRIVGIELSKLVLRQNKPMIDEMADNFGKPWLSEDIKFLTTTYRLSVPASDIASTLGRDVLGVCFQILTRFGPPVPDKVLKKYDVNREVHQFQCRQLQTPETRARNNSQEVRFASYAIGDNVTINEGSFAGLPGVISALDTPAERATVLVSLFERETPVALMFSQLSACQPPEPNQS